MQDTAETDNWFERGAKSIASASPTWSRVFFEQYRRGRELSLKDAFQLEAILAIHGVRHTVYRYRSPRR